MTTKNQRDALTIVARGPGRSTLAIESMWLGDRFGHRMVWSEEGRQQILLTSLEGRAGDHRPPSPPLQQMSRQAMGRDAILFGLGMAGANHWSASMQAQSGTARNVGLQVEWACLVRQPDVRLGCRYQVSPDAWRTADDQATIWVWRPADGRSGNSLRPAVQGLEGTAIEMDAHQLVIRPTGRVAPGNTLAWGVRLSLVVDF